jgi:hypothetical protein
MKGAASVKVGMKRFPSGEPPASAGSSFTDRRAPRAYWLSLHQGANLVELPDIRYV